MASADSKYRVEFRMTLVKEGADEAPMVESNVVWNGLPYMAAVQLEQLGVGMLEKTVEMGYAQAAEIGQGPKTTKTERR